MNILVNVISIVSCILLGLVCCGTLNMWWNIIRYQTVKIEYAIAVLVGFVAIGCNFLLLFVIANIRGL